MESTMMIVRMVRGAIWVVLMGVAMGSLMMWIMMPTNIYGHHWLRSIRKEVNNSTFIGTQGSTLLIYTFPILFFAALSCVYLHLGKKLDDLQKTYMGSDGKKEFLEQWKRPLLVRAPLGIVSGVELSFFLMFMALLLWSLWTYLHNNFSKIYPGFFTKDDLKLWQVKLEITGFYLGIVGNIALSFLFFPVTRGSSVLALFGLTSEASIKYHIWLGHIAMVLFTAHGICYIIFWGITHEISEMIKWDYTGISNVAGELSLLAGLILWSTTFPRVRRKMFELFFYTHYLYLLFIFFFILHVGISYSYIMLPGFYLFFVDRFLRFLQSRNRLRLLSSRVVPCDTLELNFAKTPGLKYSPTSIVFMNVPSISKLQWHPFTMSSSSNLEPDSLSVIVKNEGAWSQKLYQILSSPSSIDRLDVSIEGPYGPVSSHFLRHDKLVMVSGGSGITPFFSIIREFIFLSTELKSKTPQLILICAFKKSSDLTMLNLLLPISGTPSDLSNLQLRIEAYVTRETAPATEDYTKHQRMVWFKPSPTDAPVSAILGPNSWLWLGAVIASSFVMFLILMGIITRYYIYPIDHNTNEHFSTSSKAVLHILVMSMCIAAGGSIAVLVNKRRNANDFKQIQNLESSTTIGSLSLRLSDEGGVDSESLPHQSLVQATNVHYGARPDLKRLLFECKGSSVGVLVCGPRKLRHDVAAICSSGLANNLYFESISFSW